MYGRLDAITKQRMDLNTNLGLRRRCLQCLFVLLSVLLTMIGSCLVGTGIFLHLWKQFERPLLTHLAIAAIALGAGSIATGVLGCCSVCTKRNAIHITFIVSAVCGLVAALVVGCWLIWQRITLLDDSTNSLRIAIDSYFDDERSKQFMNDVQNRLNCCGADGGYGDYGHHSAEDSTAICELEFFGKPCHEPLAEYLSQKLMLVLGLTAGSGFLLVIVLVQFLVMFCIGSRTNVNETI